MANIPPTKDESSIAGILRRVGLSDGTIQKGIDAEARGLRTKAIEHVRAGLVQIIEACKVLTAVPEQAGLTPDSWQALRVTSDALFHLVVDRKENDRFAELAVLVRRWQKEWGGAPFGSAAASIQDKAKALAYTLEKAKTIGLEASIVQSAGQRAPIATGPKPTRDKVAAYLAADLRLFFRLSVSPDDACNAVYAAMPARELGTATDRSRAHLDEVFSEDSEKTVIAAFKALGCPREKADQLFKAATIKRNRHLKKRRRDTNQRRR